MIPCYIANACIHLLSIILLVMLCPFSHYLFHQNRMFSEGICCLPIGNYLSSQNDSQCYTY